MLLHKHMEKRLIEKKCRITPLQENDKKPSF